jgi:hypothetical protein
VLNPAGINQGANVTGAVAYHEVQRQRMTVIADLQKSYDMGECGIDVAHELALLIKTGEVGDHRIDLTGVHAQVRSCPQLPRRK